MKKICIDARMLNASGIGTYLQNLLPYLDNHFKLFVLGDESRVEKLNLKHADYIQTETPIYSIKEQLKLPFTIPSCDLFWSPHFNIPLLPIRAKKRAVTIHDVFHLKFFHTLPAAQRIYAKTLFKAASSFSDAIITVSHFSKQEIIHYLKVKEEKIHVIHNGVNSIFNSHLSINEREKVKRKYAIPERFLLFVGNVKPHKNIKNLIQAFHLLKKYNGFSKIKLLVIGKRKGFISGEEGIEKQIHNLSLEKEILFLDSVQSEELPVFYNLASALILPSFYEGFGLPPLEAMSCGCPAIVSDIPCFREIYQDACLFINPSDPDAIQKEIVKVLSNMKLREELLKKGAEQAKKYSWEKAATNHLYIFEKTLALK